VCGAYPAVTVTSIVRSQRVDDTLGLLKSPAIPRRRLRHLKFSTTA